VEVDVGPIHVHPQPPSNHPSLLPQHSHMHQRVVAAETWVPSFAIATCQAKAKVDGGQTWQTLLRWVSIVCTYCTVYCTLDSTGTAHAIKQGAWRGRRGYRRSSHESIIDDYLATIRSNLTRIISGGGVITTYDSLALALR
jgi:hypothetical protein